MFIDSIDECALFAICCLSAYKHTGILSFKECAKEINEKLIELYDSDKNIFLKLTDKKDSKYSSTEIALYILSLILYSTEFDRESELKPIISSVYRKFFINNSILTCWPDAPTLDEVERYRGLSLKSDDMLEETYFRMSVLPTPKSTGMAPVFIKNLTYSRKKDNLSPGRNSFDSNKNMFNFFAIIHFFKDDIEDFMGFNYTPPEDTDTIRQDSTDEKSSPASEEIKQDNPPVNNSDANLKKNESSDDLPIRDLNTSSLPYENEFMDLKNCKKDITMSLSNIPGYKTVLTPKLLMNPHTVKPKNNKKSKKKRPSKRKSK